MIFSMEWSGAISRLRKLSFLVATISPTFFANAAVSPSANSVYSILEAEIPSPTCKKQLAGLNKFRLLFALPELEELFTKHKSPKLQSLLTGWSSDLLIAIVLQTEQEFVAQCGSSKKMEVILGILKGAYLRKLGISKVRQEDRDLLFRGLLVLKDDWNRLQKKIAGLGIKNESAASVLAKVYGEVRQVAGVWVVNASAPLALLLQVLVREICEGKEICAFWDRRWIYKVIITPENVAAYLPETAVLVLSEELVKKLTLLHKIVILHELTHVAERGAWLLSGRRWGEEFLAFSGWKRSQSGAWGTKVIVDSKGRVDELTQLSASSPFSILPDPVYSASDEKGKPLDGFVLGKSFDESVRRNDPSEDLADHVAVYRYYPERFCLRGKAIAQNKFRWIAKNIFRAAPRLSCQME